MAVFGDGGGGGGGRGLYKNDSGPILHFTVQAPIVGYTSPQRLLSQNTNLHLSGSLKRPRSLVELQV